MADSVLTSTSVSLTAFLSQETEDHEDDEMKEHWTSLIEDEQYLRLLLDKQIIGNNVINTHVADSIKIARSNAIKWIFNMRSVHRFSFYTAYLSVTYIDRFLSKEHITSEKPWVIRLLAIACLSLAGKMNDNNNWKNWRLLSLQNNEYEFSMSVIQRMELMVLTKLDWRMRLITPFHFIGYFVSCLSKESVPEKRLISLITQIICAATNDMNIMARCSATIAMAATLMAIDQDLSKESMEMKVKMTCLSQLFDHADVYTCYRRMLKLEPLTLNTLKSDPAKNEEIPLKRREYVKRKRS